MQLSDEALGSMKDFRKTQAEWHRQVRKKDFSVADTRAAKDKYHQAQLDLCLIVSIECGIFAEIDQ